MGYINYRNTNRTTQGFFMADLSEKDTGHTEPTVAQARAAAGLSGKGPPQDMEEFLALTEDDG